LALLRRSWISKLEEFPPEFLRRHGDLVALTFLRTDEEGVAPHSMRHLHHMGASWINDTLQKLMEKYPSYWRIELFADQVAALMTYDTRAALEAWREARASNKPFSWEDFLESPWETWTLEMCKALVEAHGYCYLKLPPERKTLPLLLIALRTGPNLLKQLPAEKVTEAIALRAMVEVGVLPGQIPRHIRDSPSFLEALGELPECLYHPTAIEALIDEQINEQNIQEPGITGLDQFNRTWIDKLLQQDPRRALDFERWDRLHWGLRAYREGGASLDDVKSRLSPALLPDFLAAVGPFVAGRVTPAGASGSSLASPPQPARAPE